jgi:hypothetical protein
MHWLEIASTGAADNAFLEADFPRFPVRRDHVGTTQGVPMSDRFSSHAPSLTGPASSGFAIVPDDTLRISLRLYSDSIAGTWGCRMR